eukprot:1267165-Rhodomonas_salina.2
MRAILLSCYGTTAQCPVLALPRSAICIRAGYAMSGTHLRTHPVLTYQLPAVYPHASTGCAAQMQYWDIMMQVHGACATRCAVRKQTYTKQSLRYEVHGTEIAYGAIRYGS